MIDFNINKCPFCHKEISHLVNDDCTTGTADCLNCNFYSDIKNNKYETVRFNNHLYDYE